MKPTSFVSRVTPNWAAPLVAMFVFVSYIVVPVVIGFMVMLAFWNPRKK